MTEVVPTHRSTKNKFGFLLPMLPQGKKTPINFHERGYTCLVPPTGIHMCCPPPGMLPLLPQGMLLPPQGINAGCPPTRHVPLVESSILKSSIYHSSFSFHISVTAKKMCFPPPTCCLCVTLTVNTGWFKHKTPISFRRQCPRRF